MPQENVDCKEMFVSALLSYSCCDKIIFSDSSHNFMFEIKMNPWALNIICAVTIHVRNLNP